MSGSYTSPHGNQSEHLKAAHDWLARAEQQFASGQEIIAAATLMLAQAEMKLLVEGVASVSPVEKAGAKPRAGRLLPIGRSILAVAGLAACMLIGIAIGRAMMPQTSLIVPIETPAPVIQISETEPVGNLTAVSPASTQEQTPLVADAGVIDQRENTGVPETPKPVTPIRHPSPTRPQPVSIHNPEASSPPPEPLAPEPAVSEPATETSEVVPAPSERGISAAEVALRTIRALSARLLREDTK